MTVFGFKRKDYTPQDAVDYDDLVACGAFLYTHTVDGVFATGESLIGGAKTISGIVLICKMQDKLAGDTGAWAALYIDDQAASAVWLNSDGDYDGLFSSGGAGGWDMYGFSKYYKTLNLAIPSTSYDIKAEGDGTFKRTFKVVVLSI